MILNNQEAKTMLQKARLFTVEEAIEIYPEDERDGRDDFQMLADEAGYILSCFHEDGHCYKDDYNDAKEMLRKTNYGKTIPLNPKTLKPMHGYWPGDIQNAKDTVNEVARLKRFVERLEKKGYHSRWL